MQTFPAWFYGPDGQSAICDSADAVPKGWADHPSKVKGGPLDRDGHPGGSKPRKKSPAEK
jgi:hypothetical protein